MAARNEAAIKEAKEIRILRRKQLEDRTGLSRSTIYARLNPKSPSYDPTFPKPIELGHGMKNPPVGWLESEVESWLTAQIEMSRKAA
ncbi:MAG: AlpA family phage regulatory protein [Azonexus sp.]|nr:AlpA family phage regulatory protein [Azonexus sp.]MCK6411482.1 AlpA family phage regulatory protein [Azonexus sp.]